jgi:hypothetical protein
LRWCCSQWSAPPKPGSCLRGTPYDSSSVSIGASVTLQQGKYMKYNALP